jgi:hypothetical protein
MIPVASHLISGDHLGAPVTTILHSSANTGVRRMLRNVLRWLPLSIYLLHLRICLNLINLIRQICFV